MMFYRIFLSLQVKRCTIITYKHGIYDLPHEFPNDLKLRILGNWEVWGKCLNFIEWKPSAQSSCQNKSFLNTSKILLQNRNENYLTWKLKLVSDILWMIVIACSCLSKMELSMTKANGFQCKAISTKSLILDIVDIPDPPLITIFGKKIFNLTQAAVNLFNLIAIYGRSYLNGNYKITFYQRRIYTPAIV